MTLLANPDAFKKSFGRFKGDSDDLVTLVHLGDGDLEEDSWYTTSVLFFLSPAGLSLLRAASG